MSYCRRCGDLFFKSECHCKPFSVVSVDTDLEGDIISREDPKKIYARDAEHAAEKFAEYEWNEEPGPDGRGWLLEVEGKTFHVTAEPTINFNVSEERNRENSSSYR